MTELKVTLVAPLFSQEKLIEWKRYYEIVFSDEDVVGASLFSQEKLIEWKRICKPCCGFKLVKLSSRKRNKIAINRQRLSRDELLAVFFL